MKKSLLVLLVASLLANAALVVAFLNGPREAAEVAPLNPVAASTAASSPAAKLGSALAGATEKPSPTTWSSLNAADPATLAARLRAAGFPPKMVQALVVAAINEEYSARRLKALQDDADQPYWRTLGRGMSAATMTEFRKSWFEQQNAVKQLMGADYAPPEDLVKMQQRMFGDLPAEKIDALQRIQADYGDLQQQIFQGAGGAMMSWDREKMALLEKEKRADIAAMLTPEELLAYERRASNTANRLRMQLLAFDATQTEYEAIFDRQNAFDQRFAPMMGNLASDKEQAERKTAEEQLKSDIKAALGEARYNEYQRAMDPGYVAVTRIATSLQLGDPAQKATAIWTMQKDVQARATEVQQDRTMSGPERLQAATALANEANTKLNEILGPQGTAAYKQSQGGNWLRGLENVIKPRTPPAAKPSGG
jgi:hypothetical protein